MIDRQPIAFSDHNYETDPRPFADCLKDFAARINGGKVYGARPKAAAELRVPEKSLQNWMDGRTCPYEPSMRRLMTFLVVRVDNTPT